ncbi:hypothetical protein [Paenibacillus sp. MBLB4367]
MRQGHQGQINPEWVETLMGFPAGWTNIDGQHRMERNSMNGNRHASQLA